jgi:hypothetical protein
VGIAVHIAGSEDKTSAELKRIFAKLVLAVSGGAGALARDLVVLPKYMKQVRMAQISGFECLTLLVYQKRKLDAGLFAEQARVVHIGQSDGGKLRSLGAKRCFMLAQLRDVLTAEDSAPVAEKNNDSGSLFP